jgi:flagellin-specific chaperone FliS
MYRGVIEAQQQRDSQRLVDVIRVLEIERDTWRQVCEHLASSNHRSNHSIPAPHAAATNRLSLEA